MKWNGRYWGTMPQRWRARVRARFRGTLPWSAWVKVDDRWVRVYRWHGRLALEAHDVAECLDE